MKLFKKLALLCTALTMVVGFGAMTACGGGGSDDSSSVETPATAYTITVLNANGSKAQDVMVQVCTADMTMCLMPIPVDANGTAIISADEKEYVVHVWDSMMSQEYSLQGNHTVTAYGSYTVQIAE